jgi:hypothetical protein
VAGGGTDERKSPPFGSFRWKQKSNYELPWRLLCAGRAGLHIACEEVVV